MEKIQVTDAMRQRILAHINGMEQKTAARARVIPFRRLMTLAACLVLLAAGAFSTRYFMPAEPVEPQPSDGVMAGNGIVKVADAAALSQAVGFPVTGPAQLPFTVTETVYTSYFDELAQIDYVGEGRSVSFRQSLGDGDNSGDYDVYAQTEVREIGGLTVTLKGEGQLYSLAIWDDGTYAYSIRAGSGLSIQEWEAMIAGVK